MEIVNYTIEECMEYPKEQMNQRPNRVYGILSSQVNKTPNRVYGILSSQVNNAKEEATPIMTRREEKERRRAEKEERVAKQFEFVRDPLKKESFEVFSDNRSIHWGQALRITYVFPANLFKPKGEFWFIPAKELPREFPRLPGYGRSKEEAVYNYFLTFAREP